MNCHTNDARSEQESEIKTLSIDNSKQALELLVLVTGPKPGVRPPLLPENGPVVPGGGGAYKDGVLGVVPGGVPPVPGVVPPAPGVVPPAVLQFLRIKDH